MKILGTEGRRKQQAGPPSRLRTRCGRGRISGLKLEALRNVSPEAQGRLFWCLLKGRVEIDCAAAPVQGGRPRHSAAATASRSFTKKHQGSIETLPLSMNGPGQHAKYRPPTGDPGAQSRTMVEPL